MDLELIHSNLIESLPERFNVGEVNSYNNWATDFHESHIDVTYGKNANGITKSLAIFPMYFVKNSDPYNQFAFTSVEELKAIIIEECV